MQEPRAVALTCVGGKADHPVDDAAAGGAGRGGMEGVGSCIERRTTVRQCRPCTALSAGGGAGGPTCTRPSAPPGTGFPHCLGPQPWGVRCTCPQHAHDRTQSCGINTGGGRGGREGCSEKERSAGKQPASKLGCVGVQLAGPPCHRCTSTARRIKPPAPTRLPPSHGVFTALCPHSPLHLYRVLHGHAVGEADKEGGGKQHARNIEHTRQRGPAQGGWAHRNIGCDAVLWSEGRKREH